MTTLQDIIIQVRTVAAENPTFAYQKDDDNQCHYFIGGAPSCIVGHAFDRVGINQSKLLSISDDGTDVFPVIKGLVNLGFVKGDEQEDGEWYLFDHVEEAEWLKAVQDYQDKGTPWGEAVFKADLMASVS